MDRYVSRVHAYLAQAASGTDRQVRLDSLRARGIDVMGLLPAKEQKQLRGFPCEYMLLVLYDVERACAKGLPASAQLVEEALRKRLDQMKLLLGPMKRYSCRPLVEARLRAMIARGFFSQSAVDSLKTLMAQMRPPHIMHALLEIEKDGRPEMGDARLASQLALAKEHQDEMEAKGRTGAQGRRKDDKTRGRRDERRAQPRNFQDFRPGMDADRLGYGRPGQAMPVPSFGHPALVQKLMEIFDQGLVRPYEISPELRSYLEAMPVELGLRALERFELDTRDAMRYGDLTCNWNNVLGAAVQEVERPYRDPFYARDRHAYFTAYAAYADRLDRDRYYEERARDAYRELRDRDHAYRTRSRSDARDRRRSRSRSRSRSRRRSRSHSRRRSKS